MIGRSLSPFAMQLGLAGKGKGVSFLFAILLLAQSMVLVTSEIVDLGLDMIIDASSEEVHFIQGYLRAPATIDLSNIRWISNEQVSFELWDDAATYDYDFIQDVEDDEFEALETKTDPPIREPEDSSGNNDNAPGEGNEDDGQDEGETTGEENDANDEEQKEDPVIPSEDKINSNEDNEGGDSESGDENPAEPSPSATEPEDKEEGESVETNDTPQGNSEQDEGKDKSEGETSNEAQKNNNKNNNNSGDNDAEPSPSVTEPENKEEGESVETNDTPQGNNEQDEGKDKSEGETTNEAQKNNNSGDNDVEGEEEKEGSADEDDEKAAPPEEEEPTPVAPSGDNNDNGGDENDQEEEVSTPVDEQEGESRPAAPSGDQKDKGGDENDQEEEVSTPVDEQEGESTPAAPSGDQNDNGGDEDEQEEESTPKEDGDTPPPTGATIDGGDRRLQDTKVEQVVDIALFIVRPNCVKDEWGNCEWVSMGIGAYDSEMVGGMSYCCNVDTAERGLCKRESIGHMMVDHDKFDKVNGDHRKVKVPSVPLRDFEMEDPLFEVKESGNYFMIIANCDDDGLGVITLGNMEWKSVGGYLPGDMFYLMYFYGATTAVYLVLGLWYYSGMRMFQEAAIPIQKYFLGTIILGFLATGFQGLNLLYWNAAGIRSPAVVWIALALGTLFKASLSCLGVMVAKGWGVVRDTLGLTLCKIILLGLLYFGLALVRDFLQLASSSASLVSSKEQEEFDLALVLTLVIFCINVGFYFWIIYSARATADYLKNMNQTSKLRRHLRLRCLIITSMIISVALTGANAIQAMSGPLFPYAVESIMSLDQVWIIKAVGYANYLFILIGVTILWRPTSDSKDYAMQMQIPSGNEENDLELSCVVPSADDMGMDEGFTIHDAIRT